MSGRRERVAKAIFEELKRQEVYVGPDGDKNLTSVNVDGHIDLVAVADAAQKAATD